MAVNAEVYETDVKHVRPGQRAVVTSRAFLPPYDRQGLQGRVTQVGRMIAAAALRGLDPLAPSDRHVIEVRIELDEPSSRLASHYTNLQVDVRIQVRPDAR